jgi:Ca-activated chloride channel family protein
VTQDLVYRFLHPWWLLALPLPFVWLLIQRWRETSSPPAVLYSDLSDLKGLPVSIGQRIHYLLPWGRCLALVLGVLALARPQSGTVEYSSSSLGVDIAMVLDVSGSMQEMDFKPNRLEAMKEAAVKFIRQRESDRVTVVVFGESAGVLCPPTLDMGAAQMFIEAIQDGILRNQSTAVGEGLALGVDKLKDSPAKSRIAILLTDGENNSGKILPMQAAEIAKSLKVRVYTIGVGREELGMALNLGGGQITQMPMARPQFDDKTLKQIAELTGGRYYHATDENALKKVYDEIDQMEKTEIETREAADYNEQFMVFWFPGLFLLALEFLLRAFWLRRLP